MLMNSVEIDYTRCGGRGECIDVCPNGVWEWGTVEFKKLGMISVKRRVPVPSYDEEKCEGCMRCVNTCPKGIIKVFKR